jgi:23S rRNA (adenine1618-N6)-methyltransferase
LVSKKENLQHIYQKLKEIKALEIKTIEMGQGNKLSRIIAWTFLDKKQQEAWRKYRWRN